MMNGPPYTKKWRRGNQLWLMTSGGGPSSGYIIDYSSERRAISRWHQNFGQDAIITPLPDDVRLLYREMPYDEPQDHVR